MAATTPLAPLPEAHWRWAEPPRSPLPTSLEHRRAGGCSHRSPWSSGGTEQPRGRHSCSAQTGEDGTVALPRSEAMMQKPPEPCQE